MKKVMLLLFLCIVSLSGLATATVNAQENTASMAQNSKAAYLCDWRSGTEVFAKNATSHLPIASMCKIMTLNLCFEEIDSGRLSLEEELCVSENASSMGGSQVFLEAGGNYKVSELIKSICIASANDSCVAMAERIAGSEDAFVKKMNARAAELGMNDTSFVNCTGLPKTGQFSCARDVAVMLSALLHHEAYYGFSKIWMENFQHPEGRVTQMANTNKLIRSYQGCDAGKTGFTSEAGYCLAASAERGNMRIISVVMGEPDSKTRFNDVGEMFDFGFANYSSKAVLENNVMQNYYCDVAGGKQKYVSVKPERGVYIFCKKDDADEIFYEVIFDPVKAPVDCGDVVGKIIVYKNNIEADRVNLLSNESVQKSNYFDSLQELVQNWNY